MRRLQRLLVSYRLLALTQAEQALGVCELRHITSPLLTPVRVQCRVSKNTPNRQRVNALRFETYAFNLLTPLCFDQFRGHRSNIPSSRVGQHHEVCGRPRPRADGASHRH